MTSHRLTRDLKQAMLDAAILSDYAKADDEDAPGTLTQYCTTVANRHPELFFQAIVKVVPKEITTHLQQDATVEITYRTQPRWATGDESARLGSGPSSV